MSHSLFPFLLAMTTFREKSERILQTIKIEKGKKKERERERERERVREITSRKQRYKE